MDSYHQLFKAVFPLFVVLMLGVIYSFVIGASKGYQTDLRSVHGAVLDQEYRMNYYEFLHSDDSGRLLVDLRNEDRYVRGHLEGAVHIPVEQITDRGMLRKMRGRGVREVLLYSDCEHVSTMAHMMLVSLGIEGVRVLAGSYDTVMGRALRGREDSFLFFHEEKPRWNYRALVPGDGSAPAAVEPQAPAVPIPEGGC